MGLEYSLVDSLESSDLEGKITISYADATIENAWNILPDNLLKESEILKSIDCSRYSNASNCPDPLAFIFFHLSRYEEYLNHEVDQHGRFQYKNSILSKTNVSPVLNLPQVDILVQQFAEKLSQYIHQTIQVLNSDLPSVCPSIDIDSVFAYKGRPIIRHIGAMLKDLFKLRWHEISKRLSVLAKTTKDPNDNFDYQLQILSNTQAHYFIQCGPYGQFDKNIALSNSEFQNIILLLIQHGHVIGLHPSYSSDSDPDKIKREKELLEKTFQIEVKNSRQHFLKMRLPQTYRALLACGIESDWSMGYSEEFGYRAGTACPFNWFDLEKNCTTNLRIVPFFAMDVVFKQFKNTTPQICLDSTLPMRDWLKKNNLPFVFVFHNESLSQQRGWKGWHIVFEKWVKG